jgi:membrane-associated phospholipid phosphatase
VRSAPRRASLAALGAFVLVSRMDEPTALDRAVYAWARRSHRRAIERAQLPIEIFGLPGFYIPTALLLAVELRRKRRGGASTLFNGALAGWLAVRLARVVFHRPRPPRPPGRRPKSESTFPSGHTTGVTAFAIVAARVLRDERMLTARQAALLGVGLPIVTGLNRVYVREHWLTDVLAGWCLGGSVALAILSFSPSSSQPSLPSPASSTRPSSARGSAARLRANARDTS